MLNKSREITNTIQDFPNALVEAVYLCKNHHILIEIPGYNLFPAVADVMNM